MTYSEKLKKIENYDIFNTKCKSAYFEKFSRKFNIIRFPRKFPIFEIFEIFSSFFFHFIILKNDQNDEIFQKS